MMAFSLKSEMDHQISAFKENAVKENLFRTVDFSDGPQELSWG
jgi:hypothetical protein